MTATPIQENDLKRIKRIGLKYDMQINIVINTMLTFTENNIELFEKFIKTGLKK